MVNDEQIELYKATLRKAWEDGVITPHEHQILKNLRQTLGITDDMNSILEEEVKGEAQGRPGLEAYKAALEQAWIDKVITKDERAILDRLKSVLQITDEEQRQMEEDIQKKLFNNKLEGCIPNKSRSPSSQTTEPVVLKPALQTKPALKVRMPAVKTPIQQGVNSSDDDAATETASLKIGVPENDAAFWLNQGETIFTSSNGDKAKIEKAIEYFNKAIELEPLNYLAWSNKGLGLKILNRYDDALMCYERALTFQPDHLNSWFNKAVLLGCMNRYSDAAECYRKVLELEPEHELAKRDLKIITQILSSSAGK